MTRHLCVAGRVQGVGYRDALCDEAAKHGVTGWVRNRRDGSVEAVVQGAPHAVDAVVAWARSGPPAARVAEIRMDQPAAEFERPYAEFECWPTA